MRAGSAISWKPAGKEDAGFMTGTMRVAGLSPWPAIEPDGCAAARCEVAV
jgi:hypothetical protein